jgi:hypothetical protein
MPAKVHHICLSVEERASLEQISASNHRSEREKKRARMLLLCDSNTGFEQGGSRNDAQVAAELKCSPNTVYQLRRRAPQQQASEVVVRAVQKRRAARKLDGAQEAHLVALTCSTPPQGFARWSLRLLRERLIEMFVVEDIGLETIRTTLKKTRSNRG